MKLYLMRHGEAKNPSEDTSRPLTEQSRNELTRMGLTLSNMNIKLDGGIYHSGILRAEETAHLIADNLKTDGKPTKVTRLDNLDPESDTAPLIALVNSIDKDTMIVGHLPFLGSLLRQLVSGAEELPSFEPGTLIVLEKIGSRWQVFRHMVPKMLL